MTPPHMINKYFGSKMNAYKQDNLQFSCYLFREFLIVFLTFFLFTIVTNLALPCFNTNQLLCFKIILLESHYVNFVLYLKQEEKKTCNIGPQKVLQ